MGVAGAQVMKPGVYFAPTRDIIVLLSFMVAFLLLAARAAQLQISDTEVLQAEGDARFSRQLQVTANRGIIKDRNGVVLAISTPVDSVWAEPDKLREHPQSWPALEDEIGLPRNAIKTKLSRTVEGREFMYLERGLVSDHAQRVMDLNIPGVELQREYRRYYPLGSSVANLIGFTDIDDQGLEGIELAHNARLKGQHGIRHVIKDNMGRIVETISDEQRVRDGEDILLSIDSRIQQVVHQTLVKTITEHRADSASAVVVDVETGEILAITTAPSFNPNQTDTRHTTYNFAARHVFEPGSAIKPFIIAKALLDGHVRPETIIDTSPGEVYIGGFRIRDFRNYGELSVADVLKKSSNVGAIKIGTKIPPEVLAGFLDEFGLKESTGSGIVGETAGKFPNRAKWRASEHASLTYGYGFAVSMLQIVRAYAAIANGGKLMPLTIMAGDASNRSSLVMPKSVSKVMTKMLERVVTRTGTASRAKIPTYRVAGKTSTTQKLIDGVYREDLHRSMFVGFAPASNPKLAAVVLVDEPKAEQYYGGRVAAPAFREFISEALRILNVPPDDLENLAYRHGGHIERANA